MGFLNVVGGMEINIQDRDPDAMEDVFGPQGILAGRMTGYEYRPGQLAMARAVAGILQSGNESAWNQAAGGFASMLAAEAGTGIGKTLAYLVPAVLSGQKIIVSTGTLNLQEQILTREIPFITQHIAPDCSVLCVKGRQNYLCKYRWNQFASDPQMVLFQNGDERQRLEQWAEETEFGDRAELPWLADDAPLWPHLSCSTVQCLGTQCPDIQSCFITRLRKKAAGARILIVNHHLFFSDLALRRFGFAEVLPRYESVIFDEAHRLEEIATRYFGLSFSQYQVVDLVQDIERTARQNLAGRSSAKTCQLASSLAAGVASFAALFPRKRGRFPLTEWVEEVDAWPAEPQKLLDLFAGLAGHLDSLTVSGEVWEGLLHRCEELAGNLQRIAIEQDSAHVYWGERREKAVLLAASPINVAVELRDALFSEVRSLVFTSATLSTGGDFAYFAERLGLPEETEFMTIPTPFDYENRTLLYVPEQSFPAPFARDFNEASAARLRDIILLAGGRTLILFTSIAAMRAAREYLAGQLPFPMLVQGEAPKQVLLDEFSSDIHSILLAVASFWEGVDVPGEALSCVIIDKLPFEVPSDPVMMARMDAVREHGGHPFFDFQIPRAILTLRQGVGRLMRKASDRGVLAILDIRLVTKSYGRLFLKSLPASPVSRDLQELADFFKEEGQGG